MDKSEQTTYKTYVKFAFSLDSNTQLETLPATKKPTKIKEIPTPSEFALQVYSYVFFSCSGLTLTTLTRYQDTRATHEYTYKIRLRRRQTFVRRFFGAFRRTCQRSSFESPSVWLFEIEKQSRMV